MAKDFNAELDAIFMARDARIAKAQQNAADAKAVSDAFTKASAKCFQTVIAPSLSEMAALLAKRKVIARAAPFHGGIALHIVSGEARSGPGREFDGQPYLGITPELQTQRIHFERNTSGSGRGVGTGDLIPTEIDADFVKTEVMTLIRELYGSS
jgi:hypothetical protein